MAYILWGVKSGRLYQLSPRYYVATRKPVFVQILGRGILVIIHYGDWFCKGKSFVESKINSFVYFKKLECCPLGTRPTGKVLTVFVQLDVCLLWYFMFLVPCAFYRCLGIYSIGVLQSSQM